MRSILAPFAPELSLIAARAQLTQMLEPVAQDAAGFEARLLLEAATGYSALELSFRGGEKIGAACDRLNQMMTRRLAREPVTRILGQNGFFGLDLLVTSDVLDPRADTEILVETALEFLPRERDDLRLLDLGVGSGAILCALLAERPKTFGIGVDLSPAACGVARANLRRNGVADRAAVVCGDFAAALNRRFDLIVSNPPYIALDEKALLEPEVLDHDPALALFGGADGLDAYRALAGDLDRLLAPQGAAVLEIGWRQGPALQQLFAEHGFAGGQLRRDHGGRDRVLILRRVG